MSFPDNPLPPFEFEAPAASQEFLAPAPRDPVWSGWDVLLIALLTLTAIFVFLWLGIFAARHFFFPTLPLAEVAKMPELGILTQLGASCLAYLVVFAYMHLVVTRQPGAPDFLTAIRWNWPRNWGRFALLGAVLAIGLQAVAHLLPIPKNLPMDKLFQTAREAWLFSIFGTTFAPLFEELFFRAFLYPVLSRRLGMGMAVALTSIGFAAIHGAQLSFAWGPILVIFTVGLVLTTIRAVTKSVAAGLIVHSAYNGTIALAMFAATSGFRHLERLNP